jgi:hypothetical protein
MLRTMLKDGVQVELTTTWTKCDGSLFSEQGKHWWVKSNGQLFM